MNNDQSLSHTKWECKYHLTNVVFFIHDIFLTYRNILRFSIAHIVDFKYPSFYYNYNNNT